MIMKIAGIITHILAIVLIAAMVAATGAVYYSFEGPFFMLGVLYKDYGHIVVAAAFLLSACSYIFTMRSIKVEEEKHAEGAAALAVPAGAVGAVKK